MGEPRWRPERLAQKLLRIRRILDLSQSELLRRLGLEEEITYHRISEYELGKYDPPLPVLVEYGRVAGVHLEVIADDRLDLPEILPDTVKYEAWNLPRPKRKKTT
jgi:transcriptional regulator with XRE-family HTH domain